ncbi:hypothetical protein [Xylophilus sp. GOD-11R]|uniref:hypothetical protein n=1 Tax=Xylophilus sp. GOD-11R TaxID=3089814 RepID=UPI00298C571A|nr:hypothetical protein [Xylophilus sp. GOD-11R]WPB59549.1 hypothetical protein R9X41_01180 [Xylophilus sp. GOD-11R]
MRNEKQRDAFQQGVFDEGRKVESDGRPKVQTVFVAFDPQLRNVDRLAVGPGFQGGSTEQKQRRGAQK